jgi:DNA repair protein SbcC/Rad50
VGGASGVLEDLSGGQYSLATDDSGNFTVVDHHNADERRSAKTLSGGETFLASLALALALADQVAELASEGAARLESVFLDEGFGTLDSETLDTVAATVENLAAEGRMVGIVTHVAELAARVPLQYRVTKDVRSSRVERVLA